MMYPRVARAVLWIDALGALGVGFVLLAFRDAITAWYQLPPGVMTLIIGGDLVYGTCSLQLAMRPRWRSRGLVLALVAANLAFAVVCVVLFARHGNAASLFGRLHLVGEAVYLCVLAGTEWWVREALVASRADAAAV